MPAMGRVAKGTEIGVVRRNDDEPPSWSKQAVELFHRPNYVRDMFNDVDGAHLLE